MALKFLVVELLVEIGRFVGQSANIVSLDVTL